MNAMMRARESVEAGVCPTCDRKLEQVSSTLRSSHNGLEKHDRFFCPCCHLTFGLRVSPNDWTFDVDATSAIVDQGDWLPSGGPSRAMYRCEHATG